MQRHIMTAYDEVYHRLVSSAGAYLPCSVIVKTRRF